MESENVNKKQEVEAKSEGKQEPQDKTTSYAQEFDEWIKEKPRHDYIKLETNVVKTMRFKSGKPNEMIPTDFGGKLAEKVPAARYIVTTSEEPNKEQVLDITSKRLARDIQAYYERGFTELEITKLGTNPVSYRVIPNVTRERQQQMGQQQQAA